MASILLIPTYTPLEFNKSVSVIKKGGVEKQPPQVVTLVYTILQNYAQIYIDMFIHIIIFFTVTERLND